MPELGHFEDDRGVIQDLLAGPIDSVTEIFTKAGAVRGNHLHAETTQWTYVVSGHLFSVRLDPAGETWKATFGPGSLIREPAGWPHAWRAVEDTTVLVFTHGPRSGASYEDDVQRLAPGERLIG